MLGPGLAKALAEQGAAASAQGRALLSALAAGQYRFVSRQPGAGSRLLLEHLLAEQGLGSSGVQAHGSHFEETHVVVAAAVAAGTAEMGLGVEAAAHEFGLAFVALAEEDHDLVCLKAALGTPAVMSQRQALASPASGPKPCKRCQGLACIGLARCRH